MMVADVRRRLSDRAEGEVDAELVPSTDRRLRSNGPSRILGQDIYERTGKTTTYLQVMVGMEKVEEEGQ